MMIAVDDSLVAFSLELALNTGDSQKVNYICNRINEAVPQMQLPLTLQCDTILSDYFVDHDPDYLKAAPLRRLHEAIKDHRTDFAP